MDMLEIIYRIYEISEKRQDNEYSCYDDGKRIISQEVLICESRNKFKEIIKDLYCDEEIKFKASNKYETGQKYCIIISEQCYNPENYTTLIKSKCDNCGKEILALSRHVIKMPNYVIERELMANFADYESLVFCSNHCKDAKIHKAKQNCKMPDEFNQWIEPNSFETNGRAWVYKITKRSTNEFYVGQTINVPIFRWGQHLKTSRFPLENLNDYIFEIIETVADIKLLNEREKYWIQKCYVDNPEKSLNIALTNI